MNLQKDLLDFIGQYLLTSNETVSVAESVTAGFLQFSFSQMKDASKFFYGGTTAYTLEKKVDLLNINKQEAEACNCVSPAIAEAMALNCAQLFSTDWAIGVTGYATPVEESEHKLFAYFAFVYKNEIILSTKMDLHPRKEPINAQLCYSEFILECLKLEMDKKANPE